MEEKVEVVSEPLPAKGIHIKPEHKAEWVRRFKQSGLSLRKFSTQHGLRCSSLCGWLNQEPEANLAWISFREVKLPVATVERPSWSAELSLANGNVLRIWGEVPAAVLEKLLGLC